MKKPAATLLCPCGSGLKYDDCCGIYHKGDPAQTAEQLMRSRYTAYVLGNEDYLSETWHDSTRPAELNLQQTPPVKWLGLKIIAIQAGGVADNEGTVEFVARHKVAGKAHRLHEVSRFVKQDGRWFYVDGDIKN